MQLWGQDMSEWVTQLIHAAVESLVSVNRVSLSGSQAVPQPASASDTLVKISLSVVWHTVMSMWLSESFPCQDIRSIYAAITHSHQTSNSRPAKQTNQIQGCCRVEYNLPVCKLKLNSINKRIRALWAHWHFDNHQDNWLRHYKLVYACIWAETV